MQPAVWNPALVGPLPQCPTDGSWSAYRMDTDPASTRAVTADAVPRPDRPRPALTSVEPRMARGPLLWKSLCGRSEKD